MKKNGFFQAADSIWTSTPTGNKGPAEFLPVTSLRIFLKAVFHLSW